MKTFGKLVAGMLEEEMALRGMPCKVRIGKTHDYTHSKRRLGHDYAVIGIINKGKKIVMSGWGKGIKKGDYLLLDQDNWNFSTRYKVLTVFYYSDMWSIKAQFAPRMEP